MMSASPELFKRVQAVRSNGTTRGGSRKSHTHVQMTAALFSAFLLFHSVKKPLGGRPWRVRAEPAEIGGGRNPAAGYKSLRELCEKAHLSGARIIRASGEGAGRAGGPGRRRLWKREPGGHEFFCGARVAGREAGAGRGGKRAEPVGLDRGKGTLRRRRA